MFDVKGRNFQTQVMASFHIRLKQRAILDTVKCYLRHLVSKVTRRVYLECTKLRQKKRGGKKVLIILMEQLQLVKDK